MALIDTHSLIEQMIAAGINKEQAIIFTKAINQSNDNVVTKADLELSNTKLKHDLESRMDKIDTNLTWLRAIGGAILLLLIKLAFFNV